MRPTILDLCLAGERAFEQDEFEDALEWYELACFGAVTEEAEENTGIVAWRFVRLAELRQMNPWRRVHYGAPDRNHAIAIQTCAPRKLTPSLHEVWQAWTGPKSIQIDGFGSPDGIHGYAGQAQSFFAILKHAAEHEHLSYLTVFEDDVVLAKNALDYIATYKPDPDLVLTSWFSVETCIAPRTKPVLIAIPAHEYMFNQAITMSAATVRALLASDALKNWPERHGADRVYGKAFPKGKCALHFPSIVQHVGGAVSLVGNNDHGLRTSPTFIGEEADALELRR